MELIDPIAEPTTYSFSVSINDCLHNKWDFMAEAKRVWIGKRLVIDRTGANPHLDDRIAKE